MAPLVVLAKIIGTTTIGVWAGYNVAIAAGVSSVPWAQSVFGIAPQDFSASEARVALQRSRIAAQASGVTSVALLTAYFASLRSGKHPYLLYVALGVPLVGALQYVGALDLLAQLTGSASASTSSPTSTSMDLDDAHVVEHSDLTGSVYETVKKPQATDGAAPDVTSSQGLAVADKVAIYARAVSGLSLTLFVINLIGLLGDGSHVL